MSISELKSPSATILIVVAIKLKIAADNGRELLSQLAACPEVKRDEGALADLADAEETLRQLADAEVSLLRTLAAKREKAHKESNV